MTPHTHRIRVPEKQKKQLRCSKAKHSGTIIPALGRTQQRDYEFKVSLDYIVQGQLVVKKMLLS